MLSVFSEACKVTTDGGNVVIKSSSLDSNVAFGELKGPDARKLAISAAAQMGVPDPRINGDVHVFPIDGAGKVIEDQVNQKIAAYCADIPIVRRLV